MKVIIAGSRTVTNRVIVQNAVQLAKFDITEVVSGGCRGVDALGEVVAKLMGWPIKVMKADWALHGKAAGPIRNREMAAYADALIAVWDGQSRGTENMIDEMRKLGKPVYVYKVEG